MEIQIKLASYEEKSILRNLMELAQYDYSEYAAMMSMSMAFTDTNFWTITGRSRTVIRFWFVLPASLPASLWSRCTTSGPTTAMYTRSFWTSVAAPYANSGFKPHGEKENMLELELEVT
jgi:hypothetical protein